MARKRRSRKCICCDKPATRTAIVQGRSSPFCSRCPTLEELASRAAAVRETWSSIEFYARAWGCTFDQAVYRRVAYDFRVHRAIRVSDHMRRQHEDGD